MERTCASRARAIRKSKLSALSTHRRLRARSYRAVVASDWPTKRTSFGAWLALAVTLCVSLSLSREGRAREREAMRAAGMTTYCTKTSVLIAAHKMRYALLSDVARFKYQTICNTKNPHLACRRLRKRCARAGGRRAARGGGRYTIIVCLSARRARRRFVVVLLYLPG